MSSTIPACPSPKQLNAVEKKAIEQGRNLAQFGTIGYDDYCRWILDGIGSPEVEDPTLRG